MQRIVRYALSFFYALALPAVAAAQKSGTSALVPCDGINCTCGHIVTLAQNIINTGIYMFVLLAAVLFAYAGFLYLTNEAMGEQQKARKIFTGVAGGLVILLSAWLIVNTLMNSLLGQSFGPWNAIAPLDGMCKSLGIQQ